MCVPKGIFTADPGCFLCVPVQSYWFLRLDSTYATVETRVYFSATPTNTVRLYSMRCAREMHHLSVINGSDQRNYFWRCSFWHSCRLTLGHVKKKDRSSLRRMVSGLTSIFELSPALCLPRCCCVVGQSTVKRKHLFGNSNAAYSSR